MLPKQRRLIGWYRPRSVLQAFQRVKQARCPREALALLHHASVCVTRAGGVLTGPPAGNLNRRSGCHHFSAKRQYHHLWDRRFSLHNTLLALLSAVSLTIAACGDLGPHSSSPVEALIGNLRTSGATVERSGVATQPFFAVSGARLRVDGEQVEAYAFATAEEAAAAASGVSADGSQITGSGVVTNILWVASPHFFHKLRLIVLYVGDAPEVLQLLEKTLGQQFAGA